MPSLDDVLHSENQYEIEMLEISDDTLDTGSVSDLSDSPVKKPLLASRTGQSQQAYPTLQEWLNNDSVLVFVPVSGPEQDQQTPEFIDFSNNLFQTFE